MKILGKNISVLQRRDPELAGLLLRECSTEHEIFQSRNGLPTLRINNLTLHSIYDPEREAREWVNKFEEDIENASLIHVMGFGLGYHLIELCKRTKKEIIVLEPSLDILNTALRNIDLSAILGRIKVITDHCVERNNDDATVLEHSPSVRLNHQYFKEMVELLKFGVNVNNTLKILVVSPIYGGSLPIARYCSSTLKKMGHSVELIDNSRFSDALFYAREVTKDKSKHKRLCDHLTEFLSESILARCETIRPDLVLLLAQAPVTKQCFDELRRQGIPTAYWFVEDYRVMDYWKVIASHCDYFMTIQRGDFFEKLALAGAQNVRYLPMAASPDVHKKMELSKDDSDYYGSDISFLGAGYYNRKHLFKGLLDFDFKIWGNDWPSDSFLNTHLQRAGERIETEDAVKVFNASKININLHSSTTHKGINPFGDFVNPRTFEIASCGGFQLVDRRHELDALFEAGYEIILFDGIDDLRAKIQYYLEHPDERRKIAENARLRVMREHTYEHRMRDMLQFLYEEGFEPQQAKGQAVDDLVNEAGKGTDLAEYLTGFREKEKIDLSDIVNEIKKGKGDITESETLFLAMKEFAN